MAEVALILDPMFERHITGAGHPERPERLQAVRRGLSNGLSDRCGRIEPERIEDRLIERVHDPSHVRTVDRHCAAGEVLFDADTVACSESPEIARYAAGSVVAMCRAVARGRHRSGFAAVRPPGHHAERDRAMGFCLFNNVAIAARYLQDHEGVERVLIVDWDVHHGNGTQHIFDDDPSVLYFSVHQSPLYPGTGAASERGVGPGLGATVNRPLSPGAGDGEFLGTLESDLANAADRFAPGFVLVSAGFDAHRADPLAQLEVSTEGFAAATRIVRAIAKRHCEGRMVSMLEGGYDLRALADSAAAHVEALLEDGP